MTTRPAALYRLRRFTSLDRGRSHLRHPRRCRSLNNVAPPHPGSSPGRTSCTDFLTLLSALLSRPNRGTSFTARAYCQQREEGFGVSPSLDALHRPAKQSQRSCGVRCSASLRMFNGETGSSALGRNLMSQSPAIECRANVSALRFDSSAPSPASTSPRGRH
jgi:hypothetical protein